MANLDLTTLRTLVRQGDIDTVVTVFPDMYGRFLGKRMTGSYFIDHVAEEGTHACDYLLACDVDMDPVPGYRFASWKAGYGDLHCVPDLSTLRRIPWLEKSALVICDLFLSDDAHTAVPVAPRQILKNQLARLQAKGYLANGASELEFFLFRDSFEKAKEKGFHHLDTAGWYIEDYHVLQTTKDEWFIRAVRNGMAGADVPVECSKGEWGPGQHEINLSYAPFLEMADRHMVYKHGVKEIAALHNVAVTFMAKWNEKLAGSSFHLHSSLWDLENKTAKFYDAKQPHGMGRLFQHWIAGLLAHARELSLFYAPLVNSYKRYQAASFAPTRLVWSLDNRTAGFRIVGQGSSLRVENRVPGADANPYLAYAAITASGLDGIERQLELPPMFQGDAYGQKDLPMVPSSLPEAIEAFERSEFVRAVFGEQVWEHYLHAAKTEWQKFCRVVTDWELERHFERT